MNKEYTQIYYFVKKKENISYFTFLTFLSTNFKLCSFPGFIYTNSTSGINTLFIIEDKAEISFDKINDVSSVVQYPYALG